MSNERFKNTNEEAKGKSFGEFLKWNFTNKTPEPIAIETVDWNILDLAKKDEVYHDVKYYFSFDDKLRGLNLIELKI